MSGKPDKQMEAIAKRNAAMGRQHSKLILPVTADDIGSVSEDGSNKDKLNSFSETSIESEIGKVNENTETFQESETKNNNKNTEVVVLNGSDKSNPVQEPAAGIASGFLRSFNQQKKKTVEETHTRDTYLIENDLLRRLNSIAATQSKGFKMKLINHILRKALDELEREANGNE